MKRIPGKNRSHIKWFRFCPSRRGNGQEIWRVYVEQIFVSHSKYMNEDFIRLIENRIFVMGDEE